jgi:hypothetical protein
MIAALTTMEVTEIYNNIFSCFFWGVGMGEEVRYILSFSKAFLSFSVHSNLPVFFNNLKKVVLFRRVVR